MDVVKHLAQFLKQAYNPSERATPERASGLKRGFGTNIIGELADVSSMVKKQNKPTPQVGPKTPSATPASVSPMKLAIELGDPAKGFKNLAKSTMQAGKQMGQQFQQQAQRVGEMGKKFDVGLKRQGRRENAMRFMQQGVSGMLGQGTTPGQTLLGGLQSGLETNRATTQARQQAGQQFGALKQQFGGMANFVRNQAAQQAGQFRAMSNIGQPQPKISIS